MRGERPARPGRPRVALGAASVGDYQISRGVSAADFAVLVVAGLLALSAAVGAFGRADLS